jgi:hypothetical protein
VSAFSNNGRVKESRQGLLEPQRLIVRPPPNPPPGKIYDSTLHRVLIHLSPAALRIGPDGIGGLPGGGGSQKYRVEFYVSATNLFNTANLSGYSGVQTSPFFGRPTSALPGRRIETGFRFSL